MSDYLNMEYNYKFLSFVYFYLFDSKTILIRANINFLEFETSVKTYRMNPVTREKEPYLPTWSKALRFFATGSAVFFMVSNPRQQIRYILNIILAVNRSVVRRAGYHHLSSVLSIRHIRKWR